MDSCHVSQETQRKTELRQLFPSVHGKSQMHPEKMAGLSESKDNFENSDNGIMG